MSFLSRVVVPFCLGLLFLFAAPQASAAYGLPACEAIANNPNVDPVVKEAQLAHCDHVEAVLEAFLHEAPLHGLSEREAYSVAVLFIGPAHWKILTDIEFSLSCGNGTCDAGEEGADICPQDCSGGASGGGTGTSGGGPGGPGGSL